MLNVLEKTIGALRITLSAYYQLLIVGPLIVGTQCTAKSSSCLAAKSTLRWGKKIVQNKFTQFWFLTAFGWISPRSQSLNNWCWQNVWLLFVWIFCCWKFHVEQVVFAVRLIYFNRTLGMLPHIFTPVNKNVEECFVFRMRWTRKASAPQKPNGKYFNRQQKINKMIKCWIIEV